MSRYWWVLACAVIAAYAGLWLGYWQRWPWLTATDAWLLRPCAALGRSHPAWVTSWQVLCTAFGPTAFRLLGLILLGWLLVQRRYPAAVFIALTIAGSGLVLVTAKLAANRPRPATALVHAHGSSFPSGHALAATVSVLALLTIAWPLLGSRWRAALSALGIAVVCAVGAGRVALNVHNPSDVIAGWALGGLVYLACLPILRPAAGKPAARDTAN